MKCLRTNPAPKLGDRRLRANDTRDALREIDAFFRKSGKTIIALTVSEILDEEIARKLA